MPDIISAAGDCFASIAKQQGFFNYRSVYDHSTNAAQFPNPNSIEQGSTVKVPEKQMKVYDLPLDAEKKFKIIRRKTKLRIKICKADTAVVPGIAKATLTIGTKKATVTTGTMEIDDIDPLETVALLVIVLANPVAYAAPPATTPAVANQYPPAIVPADYDDPKTIWPKKGETITWNLWVGSLEPHTVVRGVLERLENLGFNCPIQKIEDADTRRCVKTYRRFVEGLAPPADTDAVADIRAHLKTRHDD